MVTTYPVLFVGGRNKTQNPTLCSLSNMAKYVLTNGGKTHAMPQPSAKGEATCEMQRENVPRERKMLLFIKEGGRFMSRRTREAVFFSF